jgi:hypothetical protein
MYPKLKVALNKELDKKVCLQFLNLKKAGVDFGAGIVKVHPSLETIRRMPDKKGQLLSIGGYIEWFYEFNLQELDETKKKAKEDWDKYENSFFIACDKFFEKQPWPEGEYIAYLSIFNCNPRFLADKTFQVFWKHPKGFISVATHEMLHFLFYDIVEDLLANHKVSENRLWSLSEVTNFFLLSEPDFIKITQDPNPHLYPDLRIMAEKLRGKWTKSRKATEFIKAVVSNP